tara:strand:- start:4900 stop:5250 length:351 start_codon:yes stop_codon:yes gene_type:complete
VSGREERVECRSPTPGRQGVRILRWKYQWVADALLAEIPATGEGVLFRDLPGRVARHLGPERVQRLGSVNWYVTTVKQDLEARGVIRRLPVAGSQRLLQGGVDETDSGAGEDSQKD